MAQNPTYDELVRRIQELEQKEAERLRSEDDLKESARKYRLLAENIDDIIWTLNAELTHYTYISPSIGRLGYTPEEFMSKPFDAFIVPKYQIHIRNAISDRLQKERESKGEDKVGRWELEFLGKGSETIHVESITRPLRDKNGVFQGLLGVTRNITERKKAELKSDQYVRELSALRDLGLVVNASLSFLEVSSAALRGIMEAIKPDLAYFFLRDGDHLVLQEVLPSTAWHTLGEIPEHKVGECICGLTVSQGKFLYSIDIHKDFRCTWDECKKAGIKSFASLPMKNDEEIIGVIGLASFTDRDFEAQAGFLETLAHQISLAVTNAQLYESIKHELTERQKAEELLHISEDKYRQLIETTDTGYVILDEQGCVIDANQKYVYLTGHELRVDIVGHQVQEWTAPHDHERNALEVQKCITQGFVRNLEIDYLTPSGQIIPIEINATVLRDSGPFRILSLCRDITERKRIKERLQQEVLFSKTTIDSLPGLFYLFDHQGRFLRWNANFEKVSGYSSAELTSLSPTDFFTGRDREMVNSAVEQTFKIGESWVEANFISKNQTKTPFLFSGRLFRFDDKPCLIGMGIDLTERKKIEESLAIEKTFIDAIFNSIPGMLYLYDSDGRLIRWNKKHELMTGYSPEELANMQLLDWYKGDVDSQKAVTEGVRTTMLTGFGDAEANLQKKDGTTIPMYFTASLLNINEKQYFTGIGLDITEKKRMEAEKEKLLTQFVEAQKMESVGRLAGGISHDFNNMLGVILGHAELALKQLVPDNPLFASLQEINKAAMRSANLTRQLLAFARKQTVSPQMLDLNETVDGMLKMLQRLIGEDIDLAWLPGKNMGSINIDPTQIDQILANLCVNARDAIKDTGKITIETSSVTLDKAYCNTHLGFVPGKYVLLVVSDNGCGMDRETQSHLFEPFFTTKETGKGTGLGLATVYGIVKQNGGFIYVYSELGQGTTFRIYLQQHSAKTVLAITSNAIFANALGSKTILLVEDEPMNLGITATMLEQHGYKVLAAATPGEAVRLARDHAEEIHLLLTDVVMPEMNGKDLARNLLSLYPNLRTLFMSGYTANVIAHHGVLDEGVHFIQKPFSMDDLGEKVREAFG